MKEKGFEPQNWKQNKSWGYQILVKNYKMIGQVLLKKNKYIFGKVWIYSISENVIYSKTQSQRDERRQFIHK